MPRDHAFVPFSGGPAGCPGRNLLLMLTSAALAGIVGRHELRLVDEARLSTDKLPGTLNLFTLRFAVRPLYAGALQSPLASV
jgi:cytochrome P450